LLHLVVSSGRCSERPGAGAARGGNESLTFPISSCTSTTLPPFSTSPLSYCTRSPLTSRGRLDPLVRRLHPRHRLHRRRPLPALWLLWRLPRAARVVQNLVRFLSSAAPFPRPLARYSALTHSARYSLTLRPFSQRPDQHRPRHPLPHHRPRLHHHLSRATRHGRLGLRGLVREQELDQHGHEWDPDL
jgi:hypothetical protein